MTTTTNAERLALALQYDPFKGDFGDPGDRSLRDKIVKFRRGGECHICAGEVTPGSQGRSLTMAWETDGLMSYRFCAECTDAMAASWNDDGKQLEARYHLRHERTKR
jgi:hypothetical protein